MSIYIYVIHIDISIVNNISIIITIMDEIETGKQQKAIVEGAETMLRYKTDEGGKKQEWRLNAKDLLLKFDKSPRNSSEKKKKKKVEDYILSQRNLLDTFIDIDDKMEDQKSNGENNNQDFELKKEDDNNNNDNEQKNDIKKNAGYTKLITIAVNTSFTINVLLFILKIIISFTSGSMSILASTLDSGLDIASGAILYFTNKIKNKKEFYKYPTGKEKLEPVGIIIFASVMGVSMLGLLQEVIIKLVMYSSSNENSNTLPIEIDTFALVTLIGNIVLKIALTIFCRIVHAKTNSISVEAYADDHRNDIISNTGVVLAVWITYTNPNLFFIDAMFAILICIYIISSWYETARDQIRKL